MAKKIRLDFSKVEERSSWNTRQIPEGLYEAKIVSVDDKDANDGTEMRTYGIKLKSKKYATRLFPYYCKLQQNQLFKIRDLFVAAGETVPKKSLNLDPEKIINAAIAVEIVDGVGQYSDRSEIQSVYPLTVLEDLDEDSDEEEYDDEEEADDEYEDDESDSDEDDEEYDEDEDDSDEEYEDDEDLDEDEEDDEELEDEELEDEDDEEEEDPAPKRAPARKAAAKKPAAKAPAKAPAKKPAAASKRVVKRSR